MKLLTIAFFWCSLWLANGDDDAATLGCKIFAADVLEPGCQRYPTAREVSGACGTIHKPCFLKKTSERGENDLDCNDCVRITYQGKVMYGQVLSSVVGVGAQDHYEVNEVGYKILNPTGSCASPSLQVMADDYECRIMTGCRTLANEIGGGTCAQITQEAVTACGSTRAQPCVVAMQDATHGKNQCDKCYEIELTDNSPEYHIRVIASQNGNDPWQMQLPGYLWSTMTGGTADCAGSVPREMRIDDEICQWSPPPIVPTVPPTPTQPPATNLPIACTVLSATPSPTCGRTPTPREIGGQAAIDACGTADKPCFVKKLVRSGGQLDRDDCSDCILITVGTHVVHGQVHSVEASTTTVDSYQINVEGYTILNGGTSPADCAAAPALTANTVTEQTCTITTNCRNLAAEVGTSVCGNFTATQVANCGTDDDNPCVVAMQDAAAGVNQCNKCYEIKMGTNEYHVKVTTSQNGAGTADPWQMQLPGWLWNRMTAQDDACTGSVAQVMQYEEESCDRSGASGRGGFLLALLLSACAAWW